MWPLSRLFRRLLDSWKSTAGYHAAGVDDAWDFYAGCLTGDGYTLAAVRNSSDKPRIFSLQLHQLCAGRLHRLDVTGERPELTLKPDGRPTLRPDEVARSIKNDHHHLAEQLRKRAFSRARPAPVRYSCFVPPNRKSGFPSGNPG